MNRTSFRRLGTAVLLAFATQAAPCQQGSGVPLLLERRDDAERRRTLKAGRTLNIFTSIDTLRGVRLMEVEGRTLKFTELAEEARSWDVERDEVQRVDAIWFGPGEQRLAINLFGSAVLGSALALPYAGILWAVEDKASAMDALKVGGLLLAIGLPPIYLVTRKSRLDTRQRWRVLGTAPH